MIDVGKVTFQDHDDQEVTRYFLNVSSVGLAASIIERVKTTNYANWLPVASLRGKASFAISTLQEVIGMLLEDGEPQIESEFVGTQMVAVA